MAAKEKERASASRGCCDYHKDGGDTYAECWNYVCSKPHSEIDPLERCSCGFSWPKGGI